MESIIFNEMRCRLFTLIDDYKFFSILFEAIPAVTLIVNSLGRVRAINSVTIEKFNVSKKEAYLMKSGKVFNCINTKEDPEACGTKKTCEECIIRNTATSAIQGNHIKRAKGKLVVELDNELMELHLLVSASPLKYNNEQFAIVILEDISNIVELQGLLPICCNCKKIYTEEGYWERLEKYIEQHSEAEFTHDICPQCIQQLYPDIKIDD
ncbi:MAG: histidine kinase [Bacillota bacterium]